MPLSGSFTQSFQQLVLDALGQRTVFDPAIDGLKLALFTADPGEGASTSNEISGGGYTRQAVVLGDATNNASNHGEIANTAVISFAASGASWSGITHAGLFKANSFTRSIRGVTNNPTQHSNLQIPASHMALSATLTVTNVRRTGSSPYHAEITVNSNTAGTYNGTDHIGNPIYFVRVKTGPLAGTCYEITNDGTNTLEIDHASEMSTEDIDGHQIEIRQKPTVAQFFGAVPASGGSALTPSGLTCADSSDADGVYLIDSTGSSDIVYPQNQPAFAGGDGWRIQGAMSTDASSTCLPPVELTNYLDDAGDDYSLFRVGDTQSSDFTITSQLSTTDQMLARFQFEDSGGSAQTLNVADGSSLDVAIGELKLTLN